jgi:hypothetical protein
MNRTFAAAIFALLVLSAPARAATIQWNLSNITPVEAVGVTVTGFFDFDTTAPCCLPSEMPSYAFRLTDNGSTIYNFIPSNSVFEDIGGGGSSLEFVLENTGATITNIDTLYFTLDAGLDGTLGPALNLTGTNFATLFSSSKFGLQYFQLQGQLVEAPISAVPLPAALPLFGAALAALGGAAWISARTQDDNHKETAPRMFRFRAPAVKWTSTRKGAMNQV